MITYQQKEKGKKMQVKLFNKKGELRRDAADKPQLMHAVDALNAAATGNYRLVYEQRQFGDKNRSIITECHEKTEKDRKADVEEKRKRLKKQEAELKKAEELLEEEVEKAANPAPEPPSEDPKPVGSASKPVTESGKQLTEAQPASTNKRTASRKTAAKK